MGYHMYGSEYLLILLAKWVGHHWQLVKSASEVNCFLLGWFKINQLSVSVARWQQRPQLCVATFFSEKLLSALQHCHYFKCCILFIVIENDFRMSWRRMSWRQSKPVFYCFFSARSDKTDPHQNEGVQDRRPWVRWCREVGSHRPVRSGNLKRPSLVLFSCNWVFRWVTDKKFRWMLISC